jgi:membrane protease YdiL (CAAX protease family)
MSTTSTSCNEETLIAMPAELTTSERRLRWFEVSLVLLAAFGMSFVSSLEIYVRKREILPLIQLPQWDIRILFEIVGLMLLGYVLFRRKLSFRDIGLRWSLRDLGAGLLVTIAAYIAYVIGYYLIHIILHTWFPKATPQSLTAGELHLHQSLIFIVLALLNPFFEELIVRAYLMTEIGELTGSWLLAVVVSTIVQSSYHLYYGWVGMLTLSCQFFVFSIYYAKTRKALPVIVAHGIFDLLAVMQMK